MDQPTPIRHRRRAFGALLVLALAAAGCDGAGGLSGPADAALSPEETLMAAGLDALSSGDYEEAQAAFGELSVVSEYECEAHYGLILAGIQDTANRLDTLVDSAALLLGAAPGFRPAQTDLLAIVENLLEPFEEFFASLVEGSTYVIANRCTLVLPEGLPVEIGEPESLLYFKARFGYEFDAAAARAIQAGFVSAQAGIRFLLAHDIEVELTDLSDAIDVIADAARGSLEIEVGGPGQVTVPTYLAAARAVAVLFERNPKLGTLADGDRFAQVDDDLELLFRTLFFRDGGAETGLLPQLALEAQSDPDTTDNVLGLIDDNGNGTVDEGDTIVIGLRELHVTGIFSEPSIEGGVRINLERGLGDVEAAIDAGHEILQVLGDQMAAVDDSNVDARRLGLQEVNELIEAIFVLDVLLTPIPEAVEADFGAYFGVPLGVRAFLPYWTDHDDDAETPAEFLLEGEGWLTNPNEPYVSFGDAPHFIDAGTFVDGDLEIDLGDIDIAADGIGPFDESLLVQVPLPVVAWQDASFNEVLYIDTAELPIDPEGPGGFEPANLYTINKATAAYATFALEEWARP